jgi:hypothetical protein
MFRSYIRPSSGDTHNIKKQDIITQMTIQIYKTNTKTKKLAKGEEIT